MNVLSDKESNSGQQILLIDRNRMKKTIIYLKQGDNHGTRELIYGPKTTPRVIPFNDERDVIYISGPSGSGKSTQAGIYAKYYHLMFPKNKIFLFSMKTSDQTLDKYPFITRIKLDDELYLDPIQLDELGDALILFDDIDAIPNKKINKEIQRLIDMVLLQGRDRHISVIFISHLSCDYRRTRLILLESNIIILFPNTVSTHNLEYLLTKNMNLSKQDVNNIIDNSKKFSCPNDFLIIHKQPRLITMKNKSYFY